MPDSQRLPRLSDLTASFGDLIAQLEMEADLPRSTWKRLYLVALKRMAAMRASHQLGHLCAAETTASRFIGPPSPSTSGGATSDSGLLRRVRSARRRLSPRRGSRTPSTCSYASST